jgi:hypothetical protein
MWVQMEKVTYKFTSAFSPKICSYFCGPSNPEARLIRYEIRKILKKPWGLSPLSHSCDHSGSQWLTSLLDIHWAVSDSSGFGSFSGLFSLHHHSVDGHHAFLRPSQKQSQQLWGGAERASVTWSVTTRKTIDPQALYAMQNHEEILSP